MIVGNRLTQYDGAAGAFSALSDATADTLFHAYTNHPGYFTPRSYQAQNLKDFRSQYSVALRDFNTAGIVAAHLGKPLTKLNGGYHLVHGNPIQINTDRVAECLKAVDSLVASL